MYWMLTIDGMRTMADPIADRPRVIDVRTGRF
jgi:hypothetical protein